MSSTTRERPQRLTQSQSERRTQARQTAEQALEKANKRRERQTGAAGLVASRASRWNLDGPDWDFIDRQKYFWNPLMDYWFRMEIEGWENLPPAVRRCPGMPGPSGSSGGDASVASGRCRARPMTP
jgi:hypothetical protein